MTPPWTSDELAYLREHYPTTAARHIAAALGRTTVAVINRARLIGVTKATYARPQAPGPRERVLQSYIQRRGTAPARAGEQSEQPRVASVWELARVQGVEA